MRRIVVAAMTTISGLVMLFSYHTSTEGSAGSGSGTTAMGSGDTSGLDAGATGDPTGSTATPSTTGTASGAGGGSTATGGSSSGNGATSSGTASKKATPAATSKIYKGNTVDTRWGPVQVAIKVKARKIIGVDAIQHPTGEKSDGINARAVPILNDEVLKAQSARIDMVSGATVTSRGYITSLQSALDAAKL